VALFRLASKAVFQLDQFEQALCFVDVVAFNQIFKVIYFVILSSPLSRQRAAPAHCRMYCGGYSLRRVLASSVLLDVVRHPLAVRHPLIVELDSLCRGVESDTR
jgi:hypothetical protein